LLLCSVEKVCERVGEREREERRGMRYVVLGEETVRAQSPTHNRRQGAREREESGT